MPWHDSCRETKSSGQSKARPMRQLIPESNKDNIEEWIINYNNFNKFCKSNNLVMDVDGCNLDDGTNIKCYHIFHFKSNQQFRFIKCDSYFFDSSILSKVHFSSTIRQAGCSGNNMHQNLAIDAATEDNGKIQLWENVNNAKNQLWDFIGVGPDISRNPLLYPE